VYVDDVVNAYLLAAAHPKPLAGGVFNVGSGVQTTLAEVVDIARQQFPIVGEPEWGTMADRSWDTDVWVSDTSLARRTLGWEPAVSLADGLARFARWLDASDELRAFYASRAAQ
jgi:nucleoside-diphosphate-sugar epimerase